MNLRPDAKAAGTALCIGGLALLMQPGALAWALREQPAWPLDTMALALGIELISLAFWCWARASADAEHQLRRWIWLRRPAQATWLAAAAGLLIPWTSLYAAAAQWLPVVAAAAIVWAGLELMAALPLARPYSDLSGPLLVMRPWLPALLPAAGFVVLWHSGELWTEVAGVREIAAALLLVTALLATLRAFGRRQWATALRWLIVSESAIAATLIATASLEPTIVLLLWLGSVGGRAFMLAGELRGATPRRGATLSRLWRVAGWAGSAALSWPLLTALMARVESTSFTSMSVAALITVLLIAFEFIAAALAVILTTYVSVRRVVPAAERRRVMRPDPALTLSHLSAFLTLSIGPGALAIAFLGGARFPWTPALIASLPAVVGGSLGLLGRKSRAPLVAGFESAGSRTRRVARFAFRSITDLERIGVGMLQRTGRAVLAPLRDLHTGDAQEYVLFVVGLSVLALVLPFLR
ncbi:MAG TPA: hypothetical protein VL123_07135 [Candidatus Udaeobacter sp.]|jgi:hypothetical protein|nr:hypothetical protein [Candidatus Udaeobacter sp.]